jgi:molybdopterin-synthase adenylyltransferase
MNRLALLQVDIAEIEDVLSGSAPLEDGCFLLLREGRGARGCRFVAADPIFAPSDGWDSQGRGQLRPSARWISSVISRAIEANAGLLFVHSHPDERFLPDFSDIDEVAILALAETIGPILEGPFAAAVVHPQGWIAGTVEEGTLQSVDRVVSVGRTIKDLSPLPTVDTKGVDRTEGMDDRQRDALGTIHDALTGLDIAVVGTGGLGSPIGEQLVRMGLRTVTLIDHDVLDTPSNVRRVFGSSVADLSATVPPPKVDIVGRHLDQLGFGSAVRRVCGDVREEGVFRELLDADIVICATDSHGSRAVINDLASTYLLPVVDVGVKGGAMANGELAALVAEIRVLTPMTPCLWCREAISADVIRAENLPLDQRERLQREGYLVGGVGEPEPSVVALTVLGAGLATCALLALLSGEGDVCPSGYIIDGLMGDSIETQPAEPLSTCRCCHQRGLGDTQPPPWLPGT